MDLAERLEALKAQNERIPDHEAKEIFLLGLYNGLTKGEAARKAGRTSTWFRRRCNPEAATYDPDFAERYETAARANKEELAEDLWTALVRVGKEGNVRALEKALAHVDPDWSWLKPQIAQGDVNIEKMMIVMRDVPTPVLEQVRLALEAKENAELPFIDGSAE